MPKWPRLGLAAATLALTCAPALAGDLPTKAQETYVKQCVSEGPGFYYIPGTDTCLRIGGFVRVEGYYNNYNDYPSQNDETYSISTAALILDARTQTDYGVLRAYVDSRTRWRTAFPWSDGPVGTSPNLYEAYIQFAGFTFGKALSFFDFYASATIYGTDPVTIGDYTLLSVAAYTMEFAKGLSATVALEDSGARNVGIRASDPTWPDVLSNYQAGTQVPDIVANLRADGAWGAAQLSGALHQVRSLDPFNTFEATDTWGYALQAGLMLNLPALGKGDVLWLQAAYVDGAVSYLGLIDPRGTQMPPDAFATGFGLSKTSGWNAVASYVHNWTDKWSTVVFGGYADFSFDDPVAQASYGASGGKNYNVGGSIVFQPVKKLTFALQYDYTYMQTSDYAPAGFWSDEETTRANQLLFYVQRNF